MKYIRKAKNTKLNGKMHDDFVTEVVPQEAFTKAHEEMGGWELVSDEECERLCGLAEEHKELHRIAEKVKADARAVTRDADAAAQKIEDDKLKAEFEEFKAWKASQSV